MKKKKHLKLRWKNIMLLIIMLICLISLIISLIKINNWQKDNIENKSIMDQINEKVEISNIPDNNSTLIIANPNIPKTNPYWDYIKLNLMDVDLSLLKKENPDTYGWLTVNGINVNYPFVKTDNNDYYLTHSFLKSKNDGGWIFADYRNKLDGTDKNLIIYGHGRINKTMFGSLKDVLNTKWLNNTDNHVLMLSTLTEDSLWQVFSVYKIPNTSDYIEVNFNNDNAYLQFLNMIKERSSYNFNTSVSSKDQIITLSTCHSETEKIVLHAKLIKKTYK